MANVVICGDNCGSNYYAFAIYEVFSLTGLLRWFYSP